jgi:uncharacterized protein YbcI
VKDGNKGKAQTEFESLRETTKDASLDRNELVETIAGQELLKLCCDISVEKSDDTSFAVE